jgi:23S rRNA (uracil-5-)-methyltransferase RumA
MKDLDRAARGRGYAEVLLVERLEVSAEAVEARCRHFGNGRLGGGSCGGCLTMDMAYDSQLREKQVQVEGLFEGVAAEVAQILPCERVFGYRNKMEFSYGRKWFVASPGEGGEGGGDGVGVPERKEPMCAVESGVGVVEKSKKAGKGGRTPRVVAPPVPRSESTRKYALGMHAPGRYDRVVEINECHLQEAVGNEILERVRRRCADLGFLAYDAVDQSGLVRNVAIRTAHNAKGELEVMVNLQTSPCEVPQRLKPLAEELVGRFPQVKVVVQNMPATADNNNMDPSLQRLLAGERTYIEQQLCGLTFEISANSFFQTNPWQAEALYAEARRVADLRPDDVVLDLFCGTGTIGLSMARFCGKVIGYEIVGEAVADAVRNAKRNCIKNVRFIEGNLDRAKDLPVETICGESAVDVIVLDPPRSGIGPKLTKELARTSARRIVYISCNPVTCARDLAYLEELAPGRFEVEGVVPVDMFPHTPHIEVVTSIRVRESVPPPSRRFAGDGEGISVMEE